MNRFKAFRIHSEGGRIVARFEQLILDDLVLPQLAPQAHCTKRRK